MRRFVSFITLSLTTSLTWAQSPIVDEEIKRNIATTTGVITFLTSQESFSAGIYSIGKEGPTQSNFSTFKLPYRNSYDMHEDGSQWSMLMGYGRFDMDQDYDIPEGKASSDWQANSLSVGIGYSKGFPDDKARWFAKMEMAYTQIDHQYTIPQNANYRFTSKDPGFGKLTFSWKTDTLSLIPSAGLVIPLSERFKEWHYEPKITYLYTRSIFEKNELAEVAANSGMLVNKINFGEPWRLDFSDWAVSLNPQVNRTDVMGTVGEGLSTSFWYEANLNFILRAPTDTWWDGLSYGFSYLQGDKFQGGQLTIGFNLGEFF